MLGMQVLCRLGSEDVEGRVRGSEGGSEGGGRVRMYMGMCTFTKLKRIKLGIYTLEDSISD